MERRKLLRFGHFNCLKIVQKEKTRISTGKTISVVFKGAKVLDCTKFFNLTVKRKKWPCRLTSLVIYNSFCFPSFHFVQIKEKHEITVFEIFSYGL